MHNYTPTHNVQLLNLHNLHNLNSIFLAYLLDMVKLFGYMYVQMYMTGYRISGFECAVNLNDTVPQALMRILLLTSELHSHAHSNVSFVCDLCENSQLQSKEPRIRIPIYGMFAP